MCFCLWLEAAGQRDFLCCFAGWPLTFSEHVITPPLLPGLNLQGQALPGQEILPGHLKAFLSQALRKSVGVSWGQSSPMAMRPGQGLLALKKDPLCSRAAGLRTSLRVDPERLGLPPLSPGPDSLQEAHHLRSVSIATRSQALPWSSAGRGGSQVPGGRCHSRMPTALLGLVSPVQALGARWEVGMAQACVGAQSCCLGPLALRAEFQKTSRLHHCAFPGCGMHRAWDPGTP